MIIFVFPCLWKSMFQFLEKICIIKFYTTVRNGAFKLIYVWIFNRYQFPVESQILGVEMESMPDLLLISQTCQIHKLCLTSTTSGVIQDRSLSLLVKYTQASLLHHFVIGKGRSLILLSGYIWLNSYNVTYKNIFLGSNNVFVFQIYPSYRTAQQIIAKLYTEYWHIRTSCRNKRRHPVPW